MREENENEELTEQQKEREYRSNYLFYCFLALLLLAVIGFRVYWNKNVGGVVVDGNSMCQTLYSGEKLLMLRKTSGMERGDIIVVDVQHYDEIKAENAGKPESAQVQYLIKRLIAVEGDKVKCEDGQVYLWEAGTSGYVPLDEPYAYYVNAEKKAEYDFGEYVVGEGEIFFLGDNRCNSLDSRFNESGSHLNRLYKASDVWGIVPEWAVENQAILEKIFFGFNGCGKK